MRKFRQAARSEEVRMYFAVIAASVCALYFNTRHLFDTAEQTFRASLFQVGSIITTTGFSTVDFDLFPQLSKTVLLLLMFMGACAGSTGGGMKVSRILILLKSARDELSRIIHPRTVKRIRLDGRPVETETLRAVYVFTAAYIAVFAASLLLIAVDDFDMTTNISAVAATINNIGPGFHLVGPTGNYASFTAFSKFVFCFDMLAGRLELLPMLVLLSPRTWKKTFRA